MAESKIQGLNTETVLLCDFSSDFAAQHPFSSDAKLYRKLLISVTTSGYGFSKIIDNPIIYNVTYTEPFTQYTGNSGSLAAYFTIVVATWGCSLWENGTNATWKVTRVRVYGIK